MITFLAPEQALFGLLVLVPLVWFLITTRAERIVRSAFGLAHISGRKTVMVVVALVVFGASVAAIAARPTSVSQEPYGVRHESAIVFVFDASESMAAYDPAGGPDRISRAKLIAQDILAAHPELPVGIYAFTDILISQLPVSEDRDAALIALRDVVFVGAVPIKTFRYNPNADTVITSPVRLETYAPALFPESAKERILVLFSDGVFKSWTEDLSQKIRSSLQENNIRLVTVTVGTSSERIPEYVHGRPTGRFVNYIPEADDRLMKKLADEGYSFSENDTRAIVQAVDEVLGNENSSYSLERTVQNDRSWWFAIPAALSLLCIMAVSIPLRDMRNLFRSLKNS